MATLAITPATGVVTLTPRWSVGSDLGGFHFMAQDLSLGGGPTQFYSLKSTAIPSGGDISAFTAYVASSGAATDHIDIGSKLTPNAYSALTSADPDLGYGSVQLYFVHHKNDGDYFTHLVPGSGVSSAVEDLKPMSQAGGPATGGASGYFGLAFAGENLGYGANQFYYLRTDAISGFTRFGSISPALAGVSTDLFDLGAAGYNALAYSTADVGYGINQMYTLRRDPVTGYTVLGTLHPVSGKVRDIANLGSVYATLTFVPGDVGFGTGRFYTTGSVNPDAQTVSFAALDDRDTAAGSFTVNPTASSGLAVSLSVVSDSTGSASISGPVAGVFTVTPTAAGRVTLQARQAGANAPIAYASNMLRQSFTVTGDTLLAITTQPVAQSASTGGTVTLSVVATGNSSVSYQWRKAGGNITDNASAFTASLVLANAQTADSGTYDVVVTNASGSLTSATVAVSVAYVAPTAVTVTVRGTLGGPIVLTPDGELPPAGTVYFARGLPAGLVLDPATGIISNIPGATITAKPGAYNVTYGTIVTDGNGAVTRGPVLTLKITIAPLPVALAGSFETLLEEFPAPGIPTAKVELRINARTGTFTGKLIQTARAKPHPFKGALTLNASNTTATASVTIRRAKNLPAYRLDLSLDSSAADADQVILAWLRQLDNSGNLVATVAESDTGVKIAKFTGASPAPWRGVYTVVLNDPANPPVNLGANPAPQGSGFGRIKVPGPGRMNFSVNLGDGKHLTASVAPGVDGSYRLYTKPYAQGGLFGGWIQFTPVAGGVAPYQVATSANSELYWTKAASNNRDRGYRAGFGPVVLVATVQRWAPPAHGTSLSSLLKLTDHAVEVVFTGASLPGADVPLLPSVLGLNDRNRFVVVAPAANAGNFTVGARTANGAFNTATGLFTGGFTLQDDRKVSIQGALLRQPGPVVSGDVVGEGYFVIPRSTPGGERTTGRVSFLAP
jgi:hypothetical protein